MHRTSEAREQKTRKENTSEQEYKIKETVRMLAITNRGIKNANIEQS